MKTQKGITLIALIITIIVMLILVGVSVSVALNTGLFKAAQGAAKNTEGAKANETKLSEGKVTVIVDGEEKTFESMEKYIESLKGGNSDATEILKLGDIVSYEQTFTDNWPTVSEWKVLSNRDGEVTVCAYMTIDDYHNYLSEGEDMPYTLNSSNETSLLTEIRRVSDFTGLLENVLGHSNGFAYLTNPDSGPDAANGYLLTQESESALNKLGYEGIYIFDTIDWSQDPWGFSTWEFLHGTSQGDEYR